MKGSNVLNTETVTLMQKDTSLSNQNYSLGCTFTPNIGYGHNGARVGNLSLMAYDPAYDISLVVYLPLIDTLRGDESFIDCVKVLYDTAWNVRSALGYPGNPNT